MEAPMMGNLLKIILMELVRIMTSLSYIGVYQWADGRRFDG
jgi:hypothetical protein